MELELSRLEEQRSRYLLAARSSPDKHVALKRLMTVERLAEQIESLRLALSSFDERTIPICVAANADRSSRFPGLGPITPPSL